MDKQDLFELMERFERSGLHRMKVTEQDFSLELEKACATTPVPQAAASAPAVAVPAAAPEREPEGELLSAPLVGTYYAAPAPGEEPFVRPGDRVEKGKPVCLIEAMKSMNEVPAPCDLIVEELLAHDGALVAFGAPILRYRHV